MNISELRPSNGQHLGGSIEFHCARAQGIIDRSRAISLSINDEYSADFASEVRLMSQVRNSSVRIRLPGIFATR